MQAWLSLYICVGVLEYGRLRSSVMCFNCWRRFVHSSVAYISASAELLAVTFCLLLDYVMGPFDNIIMYPEIDLVLNKGSLVLKDDGEGLDWSCGPQLALVRPIGS